MEWHALSARDALAELKTDPVKGLSQKQADKQYETEGPNTLAEKKRKSLAGKFLEQFSDFLVIVLLVASGISFATSYVDGSGDYMDSVIILIIVILNAVIGVVQENRAERALDALKKLSAPTASVIRNGKGARIPSARVVSGDILVLSAGDLVPADARLIESNALKAEESALTGESLPSKKDADAVSAAACPPADRKNMVFSSTVIVAGNGKAVVTATGMNTQVGRIAGLLNEQATPQTPLQIRLAKAGRVLGTIAMLICAMIFLIGVLRKSDILNSFMLAVSLAVAAIPEGLPAIVTVVLSIGVQRMAKNNAIIRHLPAVETLGGATVICSDKTGTLTQNRMTVTDVYSPEGKTVKNAESAVNILRFAGLCCNATLTGKGSSLTARGDPTENAILLAAHQAGIAVSDILKAYPRAGENPFSSERKRMSTVHRGEDGLFMVTKGAPDVLIERCGQVSVAGRVYPLTQEKKREILGHNERMAREALRVIAVSFKPIASLTEATEDSLVYLGLIGMIDPPRKEAAAAVRTCKTAGIMPVMITGDHAATARAVAEKLGIAESGDAVMTGRDIDSAAPEQLAEKARRCRVFARVTPEHKVRIVDAFRANGHIVAMTGDGVNDAPALKAADIGCAMGRSGTQVAKEAADMILTDDNFATIVKAVEQGRGIFNNIRKAVHFLLSCNFGEILVIFAASILGMPTPLLPIQLLWVNLVTDSLPALALGTERIEKDVMSRPPSPSKKSFFADGLWLDIVLEGFLIGFLTLFAFVFGLRHDGLAAGRTMAFATLSLSEIVHAFNARSEHSLFAIGPLSNKRLAAAAAVCALMQVSAVSLTPLAGIFKTVPLLAPQWLFVAALSFAPLVVMELMKALTGHGGKKRGPAIETVRSRAARLSKR